MFVCLFATSFVVAADKSLGITTDDVANYIKNYSQINKEIDALGYNDKGDSREPTKEEIQKRDDILKNYGISGPNRFEKTERIYQYSQWCEFRESPKATKEQKQYFKDTMNEKDLKSIEPKYKEVISAHDKAMKASNFKDSLNLPSFNLKKKKK